MIFSVLVSFAILIAVAVIAGGAIMYITDKELDSFSFDELLAQKHTK